MSRAYHHYWSYRDIDMIFFLMPSPSINIQKLSINFIDKDKLDKLFHILICKHQMEKEQWIYIGLKNN